MRAKKVERQSAVLRLVREHRLDGGRAALERKVHGVQTRAAVDLLADEEAERARAGRGEIEVRALRLFRGDEFGQGGSRDRGVRADEKGEAREQRHRREVAEGVVG